MTLSFYVHQGVLLGSKGAGLVGGMDAQGAKRTVFMARTTSLAIRSLRSVYRSPPDAAPGARNRGTRLEEGPIGVELDNYCIRQPRMPCLRASCDVTLIDAPS